MALTKRAVQTSSLLQKAKETAVPTCRNSIFKSQTGMERSLPLLKRNLHLDLVFKDFLVASLQAIGSYRLVLKAFYDNNMKVTERYFGFGIIDPLQVSCKTFLKQNI